jgi:cell division septal protein FtsQ
LAVEPEFRTPDEAGSVDSLFEERAAQEDNAAFLQARGRLYRLAALAGLMLAGLIYGLSPVSRVRAISVQGNDYLDADYIRTLSGVSLNSFYYLQFPDSIASKVKADPLISDCSVNMETDNVIQIVVQEKQPFGYRYDDDTPVILCTDGTQAELTSSYMSILSRVPLVVGFDDEQQTHLLANAFQDVSTAIISAMAEVRQYALSYDDEAIEVQMADGGYYFASYYTLSAINEYDQYAAYLVNSSYCLYASNGGRVTYSAACPWDEQTTAKEYWMDEEGNYITNRWGDRAVKHYYQDEDGNYYVDDSGNWIVIPIDSQGNDDPDPDFLDHYLQGWYSTGTLVIPEEYQTEEDTTSADTTQ